MTSLSNMIFGLTRVVFLLELLLRNVKVLDCDFRKSTSLIFCDTRGSGSGKVESNLKYSRYYCCTDVAGDDSSLLGFLVSADFFAKIFIKYIIYSLTYLSNKKTDEERPCY